MSTITNFVGKTGGLIQSFLGISLAQEGAQLAASSYRASGQASMMAANYNAALQDVQLARNLNRAARQIDKVASMQRTQAAATGARVASKSFLLVMNDTMSQFERELVTLRESTEQKKQAILFEGRAAQAAAENQAAAAEFAGASQAAQGIASAIGSLF